MTAFPRSGPTPADSAAPEPGAPAPVPPAGMQGEPGPLLRIVRSQKVAFVLVGATNTVVGFLFFVGFQLTIGRIWGYFATLAFAHVFSVLCAFVLYRRFVFRVRGHVLRDLGRFEVVYLVALGINYALLPVLVELLHVPVIPAQALIVFVTAMVSFFGHRGFSFRRSKRELSEADAGDNHSSPEAQFPRAVDCPNEPSSPEAQFPRAVDRANNHSSPDAGFGGAVTRPDDPSSTDAGFGGAVARPDDPSSTYGPTRAGSVESVSHRNVMERTLASANDGEQRHPLVSIVIPAFNNAAFLAETIDSVLGQTYPNLEVIISDHSSTDDTAIIMERYAGDPRVTLLTTEAGGGAVRNWNRVSQHARGEFIKLVCGDDLLYPTIVERQVEALRSGHDTVLAASPRDIVDARGSTVIHGRGLAGLTGRHTGAVAIRRTVRAGTNIFGEPACVLMRRDALEQAGWWDSRYPYLIDEATYARVLMLGSFVGVGTPLAAFRLSSEQWSVALARRQAAQAVAFHEWLLDEQLVSPRDVRVGNARARSMAATRRLVYLMLKRRMSRDTPVAHPVS